MMNFIYDFIFLLSSIYILFKTIGYAIYEIKEMNNKTSGFILISSSIIIVIFANIIMFNIN